MSNKEIQTMSPAELEEYAIQEGMQAVRDILVPDLLIVDEFEDADLKAIVKAAAHAYMKVYIASVPF